MAKIRRSAQEEVRSQKSTQKLTFTRRRFWGLAGLAVARPIALKPPQQFVKIPPHIPAPEFAIGDTVASYWPKDAWEEEYGEEPEPEIGEVAGICWHPKNQCWEYLVNWTGGSAAEWMYPCFDEYLVADTPQSPLRRVYEAH